MVANLNSFNDLLTMDLPNVEIENSEIIEGEVSDYISFVFDKSTKEYFIEIVDKETFDEFRIPIDENFDGDIVDGIEIAKEDFEQFKNLILEYV